MRYYDIQLSGNIPGSFGSGWTSHPGNGDFADPGAQEITMNLEAYNATSDPATGMVPSAASVVEIKGVSWQQIKDSNELVDQLVTINGGMKKGLPLATVQSVNAGLLVKGRIFKTWGNWVGTEMSLGMSFLAAPTSAAEGQGAGQGPGLGIIGGGAAPQVPAPQALASTSEVQQLRLNRTGYRSIDRRFITHGRAALGIGNIGNILGSVGGSNLSFLSGLASGASSVNVNGIISQFVGGGSPGLSQPINLIHNLLENMPLSSAIQQTLSTAFPGMKINMNISQMLKLNYQDAGVYQNMEQYASYILNLSKSINPDKKYLGVHMSVNGDTTNVWDGSGQQNTDIRAYDLIGQPTWIDKNIVEIKVVMRAGFVIGSTVTIPPKTLMTIQPGSVIPSYQRSNVTLEGLPVIVIKINHVGDFRSPDGNNWCTILHCFAKNPPKLSTTNVFPARTKSIEIIIPPRGPSQPQPAPEFSSMFKRTVRRY